MAGLLIFILPLTFCTGLIIGGLASLTESLTTARTWAARAEILVCAVGAGAVGVLLMASIRMALLRPGSSGYEGAYAHTVTLLGGLVFYGVTILPALTSSADKDMTWYQGYRAGFALAMVWYWGVGPALAPELFPTRLLTQ